MLWDNERNGARGYKKIENTLAQKGKKLKVLFDVTITMKKDVWTPYKIWDEREWCEDLRKVKKKMKIEHYSFGNIVINGKSYSTDVIIFPNRVKSDWWREEGHRVSIVDLKEVIKKKPKKLIIGTGAHGMVVVPDETKEKLKEKGIDFEIVKTKEACELFNKEKDVVAALHLTC